MEKHQPEHYIEEAKLPRLGSTYYTMAKQDSVSTRNKLVGVIYIKLSHMVDDKMHVNVHRTLLITQQPLGGKVQFGGQRLGRWKFGHWKHMVRLISYRNY